MLYCDLVESQARAGAILAGDGFQRGNAALVEPLGVGEPSLSSLLRFPDEALQWRHDISREECLFAADSTHQIGF